jgi:hypothetical protein
MTKKRTPSQRLASLFKEDGQGRTRARLAAEVREWVLLMDPATPQDEPDWNDPIVHELVAGVALKLGSGSPFNAAIELAFKKANLDPKNPLSWRLLLGQFCWAHFGDTKSRGAPEKWNADRYCQLLRDFDRKKSSNAALSDDRVCEFLGRQPQYRMKNGKPLTADRLMRVLKKAQDPECNAGLKFGVDRTIEAARYICEQRGLGWSSEHEAHMRKRMVAHNLQTIATSWRRKKDGPA